MVAEPKPLPIFDPSQNRGGSGRGVSFYKTAWHCARRARLDKETEHEADPGYSAKVGILGHAFLDIFYSGDARAQDIGLIQVSDVAYQGDPLREAIRLTRTYLERFPEIDFWGDVIGCEIQFPMLDAKTGLPADEDIDKIADYFQAELTTRLDLVTEVREEHIERIANRVGLTLKPGITIIDHKFKPGGMDGDKQKRPQQEKKPEQKYGMSMQFKTYPLMWNLFRPAMPCRQMVANIIVGQKEPLFQPILISAPTLEDVEILRTWLASGNLLAGTDVPNAAACYDEKFDNVCPHYTSGLCNRR